jgi:hypothetical protein
MLLIEVIRFLFVDKTNLGNKFHNSNYFILFYGINLKTDMADTKQIMATISINEAKRIEAERKKEFKMSTSRMIAILLNEALNAREAKKNTKSK